MQAALLPVRIVLCFFACVLCFQAFAWLRTRPYCSMQHLVRMFQKKTQAPWRVLPSKKGSHQGLSSTNLICLRFPRSSRCVFFCGYPRFSKFHIFRKPLGKPNPVQKSEDAPFKIRGAHGQLLVQRLRRVWQSAEEALGGAERGGELHGAAEDGLARRVPSDPGDFGDQSGWLL